MAKPNYWQLYHAKRKRRRFRRRPRYRKPDLTVEQILSWADEFHRRTDSWPKTDSGRIPGTDGQTWRAIQSALQRGRRGLRGGTTLARLLAAHRGYRNIQDLPPLTERQVLGWADAFHERTGRWPTLQSGPVLSGVQDHWRHIGEALRWGRRGLAGGSSLARLLESKRGVPNPANRPRLTHRQILAWADAHHARTGAWPKATSGRVVDALGERWSSIHSALSMGVRGLPAGVTLTQFLAQHRGARNPQRLPCYTIRQILAWADSYKQRTGHWPYASSGPIPEAPEETWRAVDSALINGSRSLQEGKSLAQLLAERRGKRIRRFPPPLTVRRILQWADAYHRRTGFWPRGRAEAVREAPGETWESVDRALRQGKRKLRVKTSLYQLLLKHRQVRRQGSRRA